MGPRILPNVGVEIGSIYEPRRVFRDEHPGFEVPVSEPLIEQPSRVFVNPIALRGFVAASANRRCLRTLGIFKEQWRPHLHTQRDTVQWTLQGHHAVGKQKRGERRDYAAQSSLSGILAGWQR